MLANIPKAIVVSVFFLRAAHAVGLWQMILLSRTLGVSLWMPYSTLTLLYSLLAVLLLMIVFGKRWARLTYTFLAVIHLLAVVGYVDDLSVPSSIAVASKVLAVTLMYVPAGDSWFNRNSPSNSFKPNPHRDGD